jgi:hypothetical protein
MARSCHGRGDDAVPSGTVGSQLGLSVRPVLGDHRIVGKPRTRRGSVLRAEGPFGIWSGFS